MRRLFIAPVCLAALAATAFASPAGSQKDTTRIFVDTVDELKAALVPANAGRRILVRAGNYEVDVALSVPQDAQLEGEGLMQGGGRPTGFLPATETRIVALPAVSGDLLRLADGASARRLVVEDVTGRSGNAIGVVSEGVGDSVSATIVECEVVNPNSASGTPEGPAGGGVVALVRNPGLAGSPPPHVGATVEIEITRSIVRAAGRALFAMNFASGGTVHVRLTGNRIAGTLEAIGGISRGDEVVGARIRILSRENVYAPTTPPRIGWLLVGGSSPPFALGTAGTSSNTVRMESNGDRIEGAREAIVAFGGRLQNAVAGPSSDNRLELKLRELGIQTSGSPAADLVLVAALSTVGSPPGDRNTLSVDLRDSTGSGPRDNAYAHSYSANPEQSGVGNRLEIAGTLRAFTESNALIDPAPPADFFAR